MSTVNLRIEDVNELAALQVEVYFKKNELIFSENNFPTGVFCLLKGKIKIFATGNQGKEQIIHLARTGELIGYRALLSEGCYNVSAMALENCVLGFIPKVDFLNLIDLNKRFRDKMLKHLSMDINEKTVRITQMAQKSVLQRLAGALLDLNLIYQDEPIVLSREDLANYIGTATETLIRLIKKLKEEKIIQVKAKALKVLELQTLKEMAGEWNALEL